MIYGLQSGWDNGNTKRGRTSIHIYYIAFNRLYRIPMYLHMHNVIGIISNVKLGIKLLLLFLATLNNLIFVPSFILP